MNNFWTDIIVAFIGAFFGFGLALFLEYLKTRSDKQKENKIVEKERENKIEYYRILLEEIIRKSRSQLSVLENYITERSKNLYELEPLEEVSTNAFTRIKNIDSRGVFEALTDKFATDNEFIEKYNKLNSCLDYLERMYCEELRRMNDSAMTKLLEDKKYIRDLIIEIPELLNRRWFQNNLSDEERKFILSTKSKYNQFIKINNSDLSKFETDFLPVLENDITPFLNEFYVQEIQSNSNKIKNRMREIKYNIKTDLLSEYKKLIPLIQQCIDEINKMIEYIKK